jgi:hypothetical protein
MIDKSIIDNIIKQSNLLALKTKREKGSIIYVNFDNIFKIRKNKLKILKKKMYLADVIYKMLIQ